MTNLCDSAQEIEFADWERRQAEHASRPPELPAVFFCEDCEIEVPPERREAQPGCSRCAPCQAEYESLMKRGLA